jgi:hypothetical protein
VSLDRPSDPRSHYSNQVARSVMRQLLAVPVLLLLASCSRVPEGSNFARERAPMPWGLVLSDQRFELPWVSLSSAGEHRWCFSNLDFSGSSAIVGLEVSAVAPFDPRRVGGRASVKIANSASDVVFDVIGPLQDPCCESRQGGGNVWASQYYHHAQAPARDVRVLYYPEPDLRTDIAGLGEYCLTMNVVAPARSLESGRARVIMSSGWK